MFEVANAIMLSAICCAQMPPEVPQHLVDMASSNGSSISGITYYLAANEENASDVNDGLSPVYTGENHGPWARQNQRQLNLQMRIL